MTAQIPLDRRLLPWLAGVAAVTLAPHAEHLPLWLSALSSLLIAWSLWRWQTGSNALHRLALLGLVVAGTAGILIEYRTIFGQEPGVALLALFMGLKLLELRARRDAIVIVMLGYFLLLTHYFNSESMAVGGWMLVALTVVTATLIRMQTPAAAPVESTRLAVLLIAQSLPLMLVLFVLFPRISGPLWGLPQDARKATTGLSEEMAPGSISELSQSANIAFRVQFAGSPPERSALYWRGPVMTDYDGRIWRTARFGSARAVAPTIDSPAATATYTLTLEPHQQRWLLALDLPVSIPPDTGYSAGLSLVRRDPLRERLRYTATSATRYRVNVRERPDVLHLARSLPPARNPQAHELAAGWRRNGESPEVVAARALEMFRNQNFVYTLRPPLLGEHAVDDFLFGTRRGFCEHYAAAFVVLMRAAGIPARVVAGYQGGEFNPVDGYMVVRQSDAHAWAEIWIENKGWIRVDPTAAIAPSRVEQGIAAALPSGEPLPEFVRGGADWARTLRFRWEALNNAWNQWILGYDAEQQRKLLSRFGLGGDWRQMIAALTILTGVTLLGLALWVLRKRAPSDPVQRIWRRFGRRMARLGVRRQPWEGPENYSKRIAATTPEYAAAADALARAYARSRYGAAGRDDLREMRAAMAQLPYFRPRPARSST